MDFDVVVIGSGPGGYVCAIRAAQLGLKTACIESSRTLGGTCLNVGCIPSKALLESSHHYHRCAHELKSHGIHFDHLKFDLGEMMVRKNGVVSGITQGVEFLFKKNKITWLKGHGRLTSDPHTVEVEADGSMLQSVKAKHIVIATGSQPTGLKDLPFDHESVIDSTDGLALKAVPKHLIVIGGGVIGLEMGSVWLRLGAQVSVLEASGKILGGMDSTASDVLMKVLSKEGMKIHLQSRFQSAEKTKKGLKVKAVNAQNETLELEGDKLLVAIGRRANTHNLGLEKLGLATEANGQVKVDEHYRTAQPHIYAIGDVIKGPMLAHKAEEEGVAVAEIIAGQKGHVSYNAIPSVVYTWPEVASVGLSEASCKEKNLPIRVGKFLFKANGRAKAMGESEGVAKFIAHAETDKLLGVHIVGPNASELIAEIAIAFEYGASAEDIARSVHAHPTLAEVLKEAALDVSKRAIHS